MIKQKEDESLWSFVGRFNNEMLEVHDLRIDMMISILFHRLKKDPLASALARDLPESVEQLMEIMQNNIHEEGINTMKDVEWVRYGRGRDRKDGEGQLRGRSEKDPGRYTYTKYQEYTPLSITKTWALMMVEKVKESISKQEKI